MKIIKIKQKKQSNGMWGTPLNCYGLDSPPISDERKYLIWNAWICAINEKFNRRFKFRNCFNYGVWVNVGDSAYYMSYDNYEVIDDILYEFDSEQEHVNFLRKIKIKQLERNNI